MGNGKEDSCLEWIVSNPNLIGEELSTVSHTLLPRYWKLKGETHPRKLCDLIFVFYDGSALAVELKATISERPVAKKQLKSSYDFLRIVRGIESVRAKIVYYGEQPFSYEDFNCELVGNDRLLIKYHDSRDNPQ
ncbi:MAG: hypothetical protein AABX51_02295 [Nanoarchaeota archaeon]